MGLRGPSDGVIDDAVRRDRPAGELVDGHGVHGRRDRVVDLGEELVDRAPRAGRGEPAAIRVGDRAGDRAPGVPRGDRGGWAREPMAADGAPATLD